MKTDGKHHSIFWFFFNLVVMIWKSAAPMHSPKKISLKIYPFFSELFCIANANAIAKSSVWTEPKGEQSLSCCCCNWNSFYRRSYLYFLTTENRPKLCEKLFTESFSNKDENNKIRWRIYVNSSEGEFHKGVIRAATKDFWIKLCPDMTSWVWNLTNGVNYDNNHKRQCYVFFWFLRGRQGHLSFSGILSAALINW